MRFESITRGKEDYSDWHFKDDSYNEKYSIALLNKDNTDLTCLLTNTAFGFNEENELDWAELITLSKKLTCYDFSELKIKKIKIKDSHYYLFNHKPFLNPIEEFLPYKFENDPEYYSIDSRLYNLLKEYKEKKNTYYHDLFEHIANNNFLISLYTCTHLEQFVECKNEVKNLELKLINNISDMFHEERSPSTSLLSKDLHSCDRYKRSVFSNDIYHLSRIISAIPLLSITPISVYDSLVDKYRDVKLNRINTTDKEEIETIMSELILTDQNISLFMKKTFELAKHGSNMLMFGFESLGAYLAYKYLPKEIGYTAIGISTMSFLTMAGNLIKTRGHDSGAILSTIFARKHRKELKKVEIETGKS